MFLLVTGGAGFIGSHVANTALKRGYRVRVLDDLSTGNRERLPPDVELRMGDVADFQLAVKAAKGVEAIVHLAAHRAVPRSLDNPLATDRANTGGTLSILEAARASGVRRVVLASSSSVYGPTAVLPTPEHVAPLPRSPYAVSKLAGEHYARVYAELFGLSTLSLRLFNVYGPNQPPDGPYAQLVPRFVDALATGHAPAIYGDGSQSRDLVYVADVVDALLIAAERQDVTGLLNIGTGRSTTVLDVLSIMTAVSGRTSGQPPTFVPARAGDVTRTCADTTRARDLLGWQATTPLEEGLAATWHHRRTPESPDRKVPGWNAP